MELKECEVITYEESGYQFPESVLHPNVYYSYKDILKFYNLEHNTENSKILVLTLKVSVEIYKHLSDLSEAVVSNSLIKIRNGVAYYNVIILQRFGELYLERVQDSVHIKNTLQDIEDHVSQISNEMHPLEEMEESDEVLQNFPETLKKSQTKVGRIVFECENFISIFNESMDQMITVLQKEIVV